MYAAIHIPDFHLHAVLRRHPEHVGKPVALLDATAGENAAKDRGKARITQLTPVARRAGVEPGMTATQGQARCPALRLLNRSDADEKIAQRLLLACGAAFSPDIEATAPGTCTIDLLGSPYLPDRIEELGEKIRASLASSFGQVPLQSHAQTSGVPPRRTASEPPSPNNQVNGSNARPAEASREGRVTLALALAVGVAENPDLALLAARLTRTVKVIRAERAEVSRFLAPLPIEAIEPSPELLGILGLWGIETLGDLTALPGQDVVERLGPEAARLWEQATGGRKRLLKLVRPPADYAQEMEFDHPVEQLDPLLFLIRRMLETIAARLAAAYRVAEEITLRLTLDDGSAHRRCFRVPDPSRDVDLLFRMIHTYLEGVTTESPVTGLRLDAIPVRPGSHQFHLFESSLRDPNRFSETMARLEALLGSDRVGTPAPLPTRRADAFALRPFLEKREKEQAEEKAGRSPRAHAPGLPPQPLTLGLPLRRFRPALPVKVVTEYDPAHAVEHPRKILSSNNSGLVRYRRGPWLGSGEWWERDDAWSRQEWDIQLDNGNLYRLVREEHQWVMEGVYRLGMRLRRRKRWEGKK